MCEISDFYSRCNSIRDMYGRLVKPECVQDADDQAEIKELERLRKEVARKHRRQEIEALRRELLYSGTHGYRKPMHSYVQNANLQ